MIYALYVGEGVHLQVYIKRAFPKITLIIDLALYVGEGVHLQMYIERAFPKITLIIDLGFICR